MSVSYVAELPEVEAALARAEADVSTFWTLVYPLRVQPP